MSGRGSAHAGQSEHRCQGCSIEDEEVCRLMAGACRVVLNLKTCQNQLRLFDGYCAGCSSDTFGEIPNPSTDRIVTGRSQVQAKTPQRYTISLNNQRICFLRRGVG